MMPDLEMTTAQQPEQKQQLQPKFDIRVQHADFSLQDVYQQLAATPYCGAVVTFVGLVRDHPELQLQALELEHYPGMTEKALLQIATEAAQRFDLKAVTVIHRIGVLAPQQQIVLVGVASAHRGSAFAGAEFIMDYLKTKAPLWKKQHDANGTAWVEAKASDQAQQQKWQ
ncbi:molybdopterin synthase catalytic subunit MoaE [Rheinheimera sp.]|uniref:molybdopterin synthase catalytic subunit MoaE n=1 Tax=Rheinheimera sp. TaxID=1869214 RepID=UPI0025E358DC|nr:molybdopterin synthase catalytic subunit MoaE [Rheinheimera sp.]